MSGPAGSEGGSQSDGATSTEPGSDAAPPEPPSSSPGRRVLTRLGLRRFVVDTRPLQYLAYRRLWLSTIVTAVGSQLTAVAVPKQIYDMTGSSAYVGLSGLVALVPLVIFSLWGGAIADAMDRRTLMLASNVGIALTSVMLWLQAAAGLASVWVVFGLLALQQACFGLNRPARSASIPRIVPGYLLPAANALNSTVGQLGMIMGPMLAGALIPVLGLSTLYLIDSFALCVTLWAVWKLPSLPPGDGAPRRAGIRNVIEGFGYLAKQKILLVSFLADIIAMVFGMPRALFPQMAQQTFGDAAGAGFALGVLFAAIPAGALTCGLLSGTFSRVRRHGVMVIAAVCTWGGAMIGFGLSNSLWLACVFLAIGGAADLVSMVFRSSILLEAATDEMRGRMQGVFTVVVAGGPRLADLGHGVAGAAVGTSAAVAGGGVLVVVVMLVAVVALPVFWRYRAPAPS